MTHHLVGSAEAAQLLGVTRQRLSQLLQSYDDFPAPEAELASGRIWSTEAIKEWQDRHLERPPGRRTDRLADGVFAAMSDGTKGALKSAEAIAMGLGHNLIANVHVLLAMTQPNPWTTDPLASVGVTWKALHPLVAPVYRDVREHDGKYPMSPSTKLSIHHAVEAAFLLGDDQIQLEHLLVGMCRTGDPTLRAVLEDLGTNPEAVSDSVVSRLARS